MLFLFRRGLEFYKKQNLGQSPSISDLELYIQKNVKVYNNKTKLKMLDIFYAINVSVSITICLLKKRCTKKENRIFEAYKMRPLNSMFRR